MQLTALHLAGWNGHAYATEFLLSEGAEITLSRNGFSFLDLALKSKQKDVCESAMNHDRWREILSVNSAAYPTPIFGLIEEIPDVCLMVLNRCISNNDLSPTSADFAVSTVLSLKLLLRKSFLQLSVIPATLFYNRIFAFLLLKIYLLFFYLDRSFI